MSIGRVGQCTVAWPCYALSLVIRLSIAVAGALAMAAVCPAARADPAEQAIAVSLGYGTFSIPEHSPQGTTLGIDYERAIWDVLWLRGSAAGGVYFDSGTSYSGHATAGATYHLDILRFVPYASVGAGAILIGGGGIQTELYPLIELGGGLDFQHSARLSYGVEIRFETLLERTSLLTAGLRMSWRL